MRIAPISPSYSTKNSSPWSISAHQVYNCIKYNTHTVFADCHRLVIGKAPTACWCYASEFERLYPEKWQEIKAVLALYRLKNS